MRRTARLVQTLPVLLALALHAQSPLTSPEKFFGFQLASDRKIARWDKIVEYFSLLEKEGGGKLKALNMGPSTMGNPFLLVIISSPNNLARLERLREVNALRSECDLQAHLPPTRVGGVLRMFTPWAEGFIDRKALISNGVFVARAAFCA